MFQPKTGPAEKRKVRSRLRSETGWSEFGRDFRDLCCPSLQRQVPPCFIWLSYNWISSGLCAFQCWLWALVWLYIWWFCQELVPRGGNEPKPKSQARTKCITGGSILSSWSIHYLQKKAPSYALNQSGLKLGNHYPWTPEPLSRPLTPYQLFLKA